MLTCWQVIVEARLKGAEWQSALAASTMTGILDCTDLEQHCQRRRGWTQTLSFKHRDTQKLVLESACVNEPFREQLKEVLQRSGPEACDCPQSDAGHTNDSHCGDI